MHFLLVSVSGHLLIRTNGRFFHQKKPHGIKLNRIEEALLAPVVHYFLYDSDTGVRYAEFGCKGAMPDLYEFLNRAYNPQLSLLKLGPDQGIVVPQNVVDTYPDLILNLDHIGLTAFKPSSGFKSGIAHLRTWEHELSSEIIYHSAACYETAAPSFLRSRSQPVASSCKAHKKTITFFRLFTMLPAIN
jgi:hypothetical protein